MSEAADAINVEDPPIVEGPLLIYIQWNGRMVNVPIDCLEFRPHWENHEDAIAYIDEYFYRGVSVKRSVAVLSKKGVDGRTHIGQLS